jgi:hypothetical protein
MSVIVTWIAFALGGLLCLMNFYLTFLRYPLHRLRGFSKESYQWVSGAPVIGSLLVALSLLGRHGQEGILAPALVLMAIDTGGLHWFVATVICHSVWDKLRGG